jgi:serine/threonine-protein kinase haspin
MPPKVYGKRVRTTYDPFAIFASPEQPKEKAKTVEAVTELVEQVQELKLYEDAWKDDRGAQRVILGERNANSKVEDGRRKVVEKEKEKKGKRRKPKRVVQDDEDEQKPSKPVEVILPVEQQVEEPVLEPLLDALQLEEQKIEPPEAQAPPGDENHCDIESNTPELQAISQQEQILEPEPAVIPDLLPTESQPAPPPDFPVKNVYTEHCHQLLALSSHPLTEFAEWSEQLSNHFNLTKIAEASFGEVYRLSLLQQLPGLTGGDESVFKVIALKAPFSTLPSDSKMRKAALKKAEAMSKPEDVANEVKLLQRMSSIPGFTNFRDVRILHGRPPPLFIDAFKAFNAGQKAKKKDLSVFPDPAKKTSYNPDQLWAVIEMQDAGTDLERLIEQGECTGIWKIWDIFWQVVLSLAKGEEGAEFEHRDLHLGNICVRSSPPLQPQESETLDVKKKLNFTSLETTIIDYTISRCLMPDHSLAYTDLSDPSQTPIFCGDSSEEYQYDIYRFMRGASLLNNPMADFSDDEVVSDAQKAGRTWREFHPVTNLMWLHFILYKLLEQVEWPSARKAPPKRNRPKEHAEWKRANDLEHKLLKMQSLLDPEAVCSHESGLRSARDIVALALVEGWLDVEDVVGSSLDEDGDGEVEGEGEGSDEVEEVGARVKELKVRIDLIEECGLEIAEEEARANNNAAKTRRTRVRKG